MDGEMPAVTQAVFDPDAVRAVLIEAEQDLEAAEVGTAQDLCAFQGCF